MAWILVKIAFINVWKKALLNGIKFTENNNINNNKQDRCYSVSLLPH